MSVPPVTAIAQRYIERPVCPAKHAGIDMRAENLVRTVRDCRADGVVFLLLKFCDPHAFDYPYIKEALDREKIPSLLLEIEDQTQAGGQLETRLETFNPDFIRTIDGERPRPFPAFYSEVRVTA